MKLAADASNMKFMLAEMGVEIFLPGFCNF